MSEGGQATAQLGERTRWRTWAGNQEATVDVVHPGSADRQRALVHGGGPPRAGAAGGRPAHRLNAELSRHGWAMTNLGEPGP